MIRKVLSRERRVLKQLSGKGLEVSANNDIIKHSEKRVRNIYNLLLISVLNPHKKTELPAKKEMWSEEY